MPTVLSARGFRFFFYSKDCDEPPHVHVEKGSSVGKIWLNPMEVAYLIGFKVAEKRVILRIVTANLADFINEWNDHCNQP